MSGKPYKSLAVDLLDLLRRDHEKAVDIFTRIDHRIHSQQLQGRDDQREIPGFAAVSLPAEAQAPRADALITDYHAAGSQDQLDVPQAAAETVIQPDRMLDGLGRKAEAALGMGRGRHTPHAATPGQGPPT
jgi:hypothetical protein